jgi:hypothetical protein
MSNESKAVKDANDALQADANAAKSTKDFGDAVTAWVVKQDPVPAPTPIPPTPTGDKLWGHCASVMLSTSTRRKEYEDMRDAGCNCPRVDGGDRSTQIALIREFGWKSFVGIVGVGGKMPSPQQCVDYARKYPEAIIEPTNEPAFGGQSIEAVAAAQIACFKALKAANPKTRVLMSSIAQAGWGMHPLDVVYKFASLGCVLGTGFNIFNIHCYSQDMATFDSWYHMWKPDSKGRSMVKAMGNPPVMITEFGQPISDAAGATTAIKEQNQAAACTAAFRYMKSQPTCIGGMWYSMSDDAPPQGRGWGMRRNNLSRRPAFLAFRDAATT